MRIIGNVLKSYDDGRPPFPDRTQIQALRAAGALAPAETVPVGSGHALQVSVPTHGLAVIEIH